MKNNSKTKTGGKIMKKLTAKHYAVAAAIGVAIIAAIIVAFKIKPAEKPNIQQDDTYYTVSFEANGGKPIESQQIKEGGVVSRPENPEREGYDFVAWYSDKEQTDEFDFSIVVNQDITLYAKWTEKSIQSEDSQNNQQASSSNEHNGNKSSSGTSTSHASNPTPTPTPEPTPTPTPTPEPTPTPTPTPTPEPTPAPTPTPTADYNLNNQQWIGFVIQSYVDKSECAQFLQGTCNRAASGAKIVKEYRYVISDVSYSAAARAAANKTRSTSASNPNSVELFLDRVYSDYANDPIGTYNPKYILNESWCAQFGLSCARW